MSALRAVFLILRGLLRSRAALALENGHICRWRGTRRFRDGWSRSRRAGSSPPPRWGGSIICTLAPPESGLLESQPPSVWGLLCLQPLAIGPVRSSLAFSCSRDA